MSLLSGTPEAAECSRAGCRASATVRIVWRNPRIHGPERRKVWLACPEHRDYLRDFLRARDFPVEVEERAP
ncbi:MULTISPECIES: hypothetical protein [Bacteria]|uniref:hypothetical protein n=1 Tax=Bacteria TaxID=2 RepID=UPI003C7B84A7